MTQIKLNNIQYKFPSTPNKVFDGLCLNLELDNDSKYNLYGIIGPSGVGKTTLISILGGQLNPDAGEVLINENNIYQIYDIDRRELIAYQMQTSTNLRGNVKSNLVFGIPDISNYNDNYLIELLEKVGLWGIFKEKEGLDTLIGEGGLNLSGGQRQRLNFASLYLRADYFKPNLVLIDEPTSSLDEISEISITKLIQELATKAIVFVVAHRLVTIKNAKGVFDLTLLEKDKNQLNHYTTTELLRKSEYYYNLIHNKATLDD